MAKLFTHKCLKCSTEYKDVDPDPYYCEPCNVERKKIAAEFDKKRAATPPTPRPKSDFQVYEEIRKAKRTQFVNIKDLGITL